MSMEVILIFTTAIPPEIRAHYQIINQNVEDHSVIGVLNLKTLASQVNVVVMSSSVVFFPIVGLTSLFFTIVLKYEAARSLNPQKSRMIRLVFLICTPIIISLSMELTLIITQALPSEMREHYKMLNVNTSDHAVIGLVDLANIPSKINFFVLSASAFALPVFGIYLRRKILLLVASSIDRSSQLKKSQNRNFINGLTLQIILPFLFNVPIFICMFYVILTKAELLFQQYMMFVLPCLPTLSRYG
ncbi:unnamed protein product [Caenorhabditis sp. 36 PRJEB53466]|nr:unnamed protein product [Caenorhabditis sp. 36 PRJEB53466]